MVGRMPRTHLGHPGGSQLVPSSPQPVSAWTAAVPALSRAAAWVGREKHLWGVKRHQKWETLFITGYHFLGHLWVMLARELKAEV